MSETILFLCVFLMKAFVWAAVDPWVCEKEAPPELDICWWHPTNHSHVDGVLDVLKNPKTYDFPKYGNPVAGLLLTPTLNNPSILVHEGNIYLLINTMQDPPKVKKEVRRLLGQAGNIWRQNDEFIEKTQNKNDWWQATDYGFVKLRFGQQFGSKQKEDGIDTVLEDVIQGNIGLLNSLSDKEIIAKLKELEPSVQIFNGYHGRGIANVRWNASSDKTPILVDELRKRFYKEARQKLLQSFKKGTEPLLQNVSEFRYHICCYSERLGGFFSCEHDDTEPELQYLPCTTPVIIGPDGKIIELPDLK